MKFEAAYREIVHGCRYEEEGGVGFYRIPLLSGLPGFAHGLSARTGGVSQGGCYSLNMSFTRPDDPRENVMENHRIFAKAARIPYESMVMDTFEHGVEITKVDHSHCGMGYLRPSLPPCDALITNDPGVTLITGHADCLPLYCIDPARRAIGLAHAGWKGTIGRIGKRMVEAMGAAFGSDPADLYAAVGPCISQEHFEVDTALGQRFAEAFPGVPLLKPGRPGHAHVDLPMGAAAQFLEAGLSPARIALSDVCTYAEAARLYSHRRDKGDTGGMAAYLRILE